MFRKCFSFAFFCIIIRRVSYTIDIFNSQCFKCRFGIFANRNYFYIRVYFFYKIFVPSLQSTSYKVNNCSKIRGLPEIIRNVIDKPFTIIEPELNITENINGYFLFNKFIIPYSQKISNKSCPIAHAIQEVSPA